MPLTDTAIRKAQRDPSKKADKRFDGGGLYLELERSGAKIWRMKYRRPVTRKENRLTFGEYPAVSLKLARTLRDDAKRLLAQGIDPGEHRNAKRQEQVARSENSFEIVAREWFTKQSGTWSASHGDRIIRRLERDIFPYLGSQPIAEINAPVLLKVLRRIEERGAQETAHRALQNCGQIFRYGIATGRNERDIAADLRGALAPVKTQHFPAVTSPEKLGELLRVLYGYDGTPVVRAALRLAPLVFVRPGELRHAKWEDINLESGEWRFTVTKTGTDHIVPLATQAVEILSELHPITGHGAYVFPSARSRKGDRPMSDNAVLAAMRRLGIPKDEMTGHGFRAAARTILDEELGFRPDLIEHQLAHAVRDPLGRAYNRTAHLPERKKMMQAWADYLEGLTKTN